MLLPPEFSPRVVKLICEYASMESALCKYVRLSLNNALHDAYVVKETDESVVVLMNAGFSLRVPKSDIGMKWEIERDTNPHSTKQLCARWFDGIFANTRNLIDGVSQIEVFKGAQNSRSCHRRVRLYASNETKEHPRNVPFFVYLKMFFPHTSLFVPHLPDNYMRESCAYKILPLCKPSVAPLCFYSSFHEESGSYCIILEDLARWSHFVQKKVKEDAAQEKDFVDFFAGAIVTLATLHGRFASWVIMMMFQNCDLHLFTQGCSLRSGEKLWQIQPSRIKLTSCTSSVLSERSFTVP